MADNGFGSKANSHDFHIRAYYLQPDFKTAGGGSGGVAVGDYIEFRDPGRRSASRIRNEQATAERILTGADIDPESIQRDRRGDLWVGDEFGPVAPALRRRRPPARGADRDARRARVAGQPVVPPVPPNTPLPPSSRSTAAAASRRWR